MTFKLPEPFEIFTEDEPNAIITGYTPDSLKQALRDVLEQAALKVESQWYSNEDAVRKAVVEIRKMKEQIK